MLSSRRLRRGSVVVAAVAIGALAVAGCSSGKGSGNGGTGSTTGPSGGSTAVQTIKYIQVGKSATTWPMFVAQDKGFFDKNHVKVDQILTQQSAGVAQGIIAGSADMGSAGVSDLVRPIQQGGSIDLVAVGVAHPPFAMVSKAGFDSWASLKGQKVTVDNAKGIGRFFFDEGAKQNGLDPSDVTFIYVGSTPDRFAALSSGSVVSAMLSPPFTEKAVAAGYKEFTTVASYVPDQPFQVLAVNKSWAQKNKQTVVNFFKAYTEAIKWLNDPANKQEAAEILSKGTSTSVEDCLTSYEFYITKIKAFEDDPVINTDKLDTFLKAMTDGGFFETQPKASSTFVDSSYVKEATSS